MEDEMKTATNMFDARRTGTVIALGAAVTQLYHQKRARSSNGLGQQNRR